MKKLFLFLFAFNLLKAEPTLEQAIYEFKQEKIELGKYEPEEVAKLANSWQEKLGEVRPVDSKVIEHLLKLVSQGETKIIMRHGEQKKSERVASISNAGIQKIEMMREIDNMQNPLTERSANECLGTLIVLEYIKEKTGKILILESSQNARACEVAKAASLMFDIDFKIKPAWNCVNYSNDLSNEEILNRLPDGALPWKSELVNAIIAPGAYERISSEVLDELAKENGENTITLVVTHTQQLNAAALAHELPTERLSYFGFILFGEQAKVFSNGVYTRQ